ncbi:MAG: ATP-dependent RecD-like DNA helicase [Clostridiales bacterium]|jgi:exodeoxyribonuclease V alpha subunit|nr:ATP-dependent RecD-like DNA helicase [Clostridiales bacterium]
MTVTGTVEDIIYRNEDNGYTVAVIDCGGAPVTVVGYFPPISEGEHLSCEGAYTKNAKYGEQFTAQNVTVSKPDTADGIIRFLSSGLIKGVGPVTAAAIVSRFGAKTFDIIEDDYTRLREIKGITADKAKGIYDSFAAVRGMQQAMMFLQRLNISPALSNKIYLKYGAACQTVIANNPYKLIDDIDGVGFARADKIALAMGVATDSAFRLRAGVRYTLEVAADRNGHTCIPRSDLIGSATELLGLREGGITAEFLDALALEGLIKFYKKNDTEFVALYRLFVTEKKLAAKLISLRDEAESIAGDIDAHIADFERSGGISFHEIQREAIRSCLTDGVLVITGGPGTGKTTIINCVMTILSKYGVSVLLTAPTGRAAKRLSEATGREAMTVHRALGYGAGGDRSFGYNELNNLEYTFVIVDEVSMVDVYLAWSLLRALRRGTRLVLVGDKDQLPSVSAGNILADILQSGLIKATQLTHIYRQSEGLLIDNAHRINNGEMPEFDNGSGSDFFFAEADSQEAARDQIITLATRRLPQFLGIDAGRIQVLSPVKNGLVGINNLNRELQARLNPPFGQKREFIMPDSVFRTGDKVMQTSNNYGLAWFRTGEFGQTVEGVGVFNGDIGVIEAVNPGVELSVRFEDGRLATYGAESAEQLSLAYAITVHKSQGCEFDVVIITVVNENYMIMTRNLLYTAITRAKKMAVITGTKRHLKRIIDNRNTTARHTLLKELLAAAVSDSRALEFDL